MRLLQIFFWECVQNVGPVAGFVTGMSFWRQGWLWAAFLVVLVGCIVGSLLIAFTESKKVDGHREPPRVIVANIFALTILASMVMLYLSAGWSNWMLDLAVGSLAGVVLGALQSLAARERIGFRHCIALGLSFSIVLILIRILFATGWPEIINILVITIVASWVIVLIDYLPAQRLKSKSLS